MKECGELRVKKLSQILWLYLVRAIALPSQQIVATTQFVSCILFPALPIKIACRKANNKIKVK